MPEMDHQEEGQEIVVKNVELEMLLPGYVFQRWTNFIGKKMVQGTNNFLFFVKILVQPDHRCNIGVKNLCNEKH